MPSSTPSSMPSVLLVPRWGGGPQSDWYPWLGTQVSSTRVLTLPEPRRPSLVTWPQAVARALPTAADALASTVVVAHSVGMHALLLALAAEPSAPPLRGALLVAGWWDIRRAFWDAIGEPWDAIEPWIDYPLDDAVVRARLGRVVVLVSDDDPIADSPHTVTGARWRSRLGAHVQVVTGRKHFNAPEEPAVLEALQGLLAP